MRKTNMVTKRKLCYMKVKNVADRILGGIGLIVLSPVYLAIIIAIKAEDGLFAPAFFSQKRVGIHKTYFQLYKFRSMKVDTPHDKPTHLLENPEQYITKTGRFLRKTSLDELPQLWNIVRGDMAVIGPRPALWNQDDLIAERDRYEANEVKPGLTGWAQINGRDELEIEYKAKLDGDYVKRMGLWMDIRCFFGTIFSVLRSDGVVEGGTGTIDKKKDVPDKKRVLLVANVAKEHVIKFHLPTIKMLKENGYFVDVACSGIDKVPYCDNQFKMCYKRNPVTIKTILGIFQLHNILKKENYDILHCNTPTGGVVARCAVMGLKKKPFLIYAAHGFHFYKGASIKNWIIYFPVEWLLSYKTDLLLVINNEDLKNAKKYKMGMKSIKLIPGMGVDQKRFEGKVDDYVKNQYIKQLELPQNEPVFIYVAEIIENKNQKVLVDALNSVRNKIGKGILLLVGPEHDGGKLKEYVKNKELSRWVKFTGWRSDIKELFAISDICVASSIREGLGLNIVEAQMAGVPVIASDNRGHREIIKDGYNGFLVEHDNEMQFADKMIELVNNSVLREKLIYNGKITSVKYSLNNSVNSIKNIYEEIQKL